MTRLITIVTSIAVVAAAAYPALYAYNSLV